MDDLTFLSVREVSALMRDRRLSPVEYLTALLARIDALDGELHSFIHRDDERSLAAARRAEAEIARGEWRGPLHGIPYGAKDLIDVAGMPTTGQSRLRLGSIADDDAVVVTRLAAAGAFCIGKLACNEFGVGGSMFDLPWPPVANPWNPAHHPGGSSSGSGAAVAAGLVPFSLGTDTGGSIRHPASACGVTGLKPTHGVVSRTGVLPMASTLEDVGPLARYTADNAIVLAAIAGYDPADPQSIREQPAGLDAEPADDLAGTRLGCIRAFHETDDPADPEMTAALDAAVAQLEELGAEVRELTVPSLSEIARPYGAIITAEAYAVHEADLRERPELFAPASREFLSLGAKVTAEEYAAALRERDALRVRFAELTAGLDAVVCASSMTPPAAMADRGELMRSYVRQARFPFNVLGSPALALPVGFSSEGLPLAMQIVGPMLGDAAVLRIGDVYERATEWYLRGLPHLAVGAP